MPHALAFTVAVFALDRLGAVGIPTRVHAVLHAVGIVIDRSSLAIGVPHGPFAGLFSVVIIALDHPGSVEVVDDIGAVFDRNAADVLFAPDFGAVRWRRALEFRAVGAAF